MSVRCKDDCVNIKTEAICVRTATTYPNTHKWPMAEAEFVQSISHGGNQSMADRISSRKMYLRRYTFSRKEDEDEGGGCDIGDQRNGQGRKKAAKAPKKGMKKSKTTSSRSFVIRLVWKCFSCASSTKVVVDQ